jgi:hypothetical protein
MERNEQDIFDELVREKLTGYTEPPDPAWIKNIHAKKNRVINLYHLYRLMLLAALVGAGIFSSTLFFTPQQAVTGDIATDGGWAVELNTAAGVQPTDNTEFVAAFENTSFSTTTQASGKNNTSSSNNTKNNTTTQTGKNFTSANNGSTKNVQAVTTKTSLSQQAGTSEAASKTVTKTTAGAGKQQSTEQPNINKQVQQPVQHSDSVSINTGKDSKEGKDGKGEKETAGSCNASFEYYTSYTGEVTFTNTSVASSSATMSWSFGDGDRSLFSDPSHQFPKTGTYEVTLHVKDNKLKCADSYTKTIAFRNPDDKNIPVSIEGVLYAGGTIVRKGVVELFVFDETEGVYMSAQTVKTSQSGEFSIPIQKGKRYLLRGNPTGSEESYVATFWGNTTEVESASDVMAMLSEDKDLIGYNIDLQMNEKDGKNEDLNAVNPLASNEQSILLLDANNNVVSIATIDANGNYNFGDVAPGEYTILNPSTGATSSKVVTGGSGSGSTTGKASGNINTGGSAPSPTDEKVTVFPNPANTVVNFGVNSATGEQATIVIMNAGGTELSRQVKTFVAGFNQTQYDLSAYPPGIYYVLVFKGNQQVLSNRVVKLAADPTK